MQQKPAAVLFVHGIQGSPGQFHFLAEALPGDIEVRNLLLPGHGAGAAEFRAAGRMDWLTAVRRETEALQDTGKRVFYVGHSMGCLLGLRIAAETDPYAGMLLLCCPFRIRITPRYLSNGLRAAGPAKPGEPPDVTATREANSVHRKHIAQQLTLIHPYAELLRLMAEARRLPNEAENLRFFFSERDEIVSPGSRALAAQAPHAAVCDLPGCTYNYFNNEARQLLRRTLRSVISEGST